MGQRFKNYTKALIFSGPFLLLVSCVSTSLPMDEWVLARSAIDAAKLVESSKHSPGNWSVAEDSYQKAELLIENKEYEAAKKLLIKARVAAEKAENSARFKRLKLGEVL
jgi:hypothetical protein